MINLIFSILCLCNSSFGHILEYDTIMTRVAANHGRGTYKIQRSLKWTEAGSPMELLENWTIGENGAMKVQLQGVGRLKDLVGGEILYTSERKSFFNEGRTQSVTAALPSHFVESLYTLRSSKVLRSLLVKMGLAPKDSLNNRPPLSSGNVIKYTPRDFVSLSRVNGVISYAIGNPKHPTFFVEQDQFVITKVAFPSGPTVTSTNYQSYSKDMYFPKSVTYSWADRTMELQTVKVTSMGQGKGLANEWSSPPAPLKIPNSPLLQEFYNQFR